MDINIHKIKSITISENTNLNRDNKDIEPSYYRTIKIISHNNSDVDNEIKTEITLFGSDHIDEKKEALLINL